MTMDQSIDLPSYELVQRFMHESGFTVPDPDVEMAFPRAEYMKLASRLIMHGADQELDAICEFAGQQSIPEKDRYFDGITVGDLKLNRRPKPPSEKEQALRLLETYGTSAVKLTPDQCDIIRRALGATPEVRQ